VAVPLLSDAWGSTSAGTWHRRVVAVSDSGAVIDVDSLALAASN
jgi:hypothetical protein